MNTIKSQPQEEEEVLKNYVLYPSLHFKKRCELGFISCTLLSIFGRLSQEIESLQLRYTQHLVRPCLKIANVFCKSTFLSVTELI